MGVLLCFCAALCLSGLPVAECGVKYQFDKLLGYFLAQLILNIDEQLGGAEVAVGRECLIHAVGIVARIGVLDAHTYGQSGLAGIGVFGDGLR